jgi:hypothetical protein
VPCNRLASFCWVGKVKKKKMAGLLLLLPFYFFSLSNGGEGSSRKNRRPPVGWGSPIENGRKNISTKRGGGGTH